jgi:hypothetical protein
MQKANITKILFTGIFLFYSTRLFALSKSGNFWGGLFGIALIVVGAIFAYTFIIGFIENKKHKDSDNGSVGCMIAIFILSILCGFVALAKSCS